MSFWQIAAAGLVLALVAGFYFRVVRPFGQLREVIRRLANRDVRPVFLASSFGVFRETAGQVQKISDLLQQLDQQVADEGFSLRAILSSMVEGVLIADGSQRIRLVNEPLQKLFDMRTSPINRTIMEVFRNHELQLAVVLAFSPELIGQAKLGIFAASLVSATAGLLLLSASSRTPRQTHLDV